MFFKNVFRTCLGFDIETTFTIHLLFSTNGSEIARVSKVTFINFIYEVVQIGDDLSEKNEIRRNSDRGSWNISPVFFESSGVCK